MGSFSQGYFQTFFSKKIKRVHLPEFLIFCLLLQILKSVASDIYLADAYLLLTRLFLSLTFSRLLFHLRHRSFPLFTVASSYWTVAGITCQNSQVSSTLHRAMRPSCPIHPGSPPSVHTHLSSFLSSHRRKICLHRNLKLQHSVFLKTNKSRLSLKSEWRDQPQRFCKILQKEKKRQRVNTPVIKCALTFQ